jgi:hypothetical protein
MKELVLVVLVDFKFLEQRLFANHDLKWQLLCFLYCYFSYLNSFISDAPLPFEHNNDLPLLVHD